MSVTQRSDTVIDGCETLPSLFRKRVEDLGPKVAIREKDFGIWNEYSWADYGERARLAGLGLKSLGLARGDICSIASEVNKEWMFADLGVICIGGITNGVYPTDAPNQVEYLINDSGTRFYFAEDEEQLDKGARGARPHADAREDHHLRHGRIAQPRRSHVPVL